MSNTLRWVCVTGNESCNGNTNKLIWNIDFYYKFPLIRLLQFYFVLLLPEKVYFTVQIFSMHIISIGLNLYVDVCRGVFRAPPNVYGGASLEKSKESFTVDFRLGSKYASGIGFTVEKIYRMSVFIWYFRSWIQKHVIAFLFPKLIKSMLV